MGRVLTVTYVFLLLGIQPFVDIPAEREVQSVSADVEQTEEIRPKIALTFDDGPSAAYTEKLLDGLRERDVHATFFLIGENIEKGDNALLVRQMARDGHLIGKSHVSSCSADEDQRRGSAQRAGGDEPSDREDHGKSGRICKTSFWRISKGTFRKNFHDPGYVDSGSAGLVCKRYRENCQQSSDAGKRK